MFKAMLGKEFRLVLRDKHALAALFILPAVFILIMSLALKNTFGGTRPMLHYRVVDNDKSTWSARVVSLLAANRTLDNSRQTTTAPGSRFVLTIPTGFAAEMDRARFDTPVVRLTVAPDVKQEMLTAFKTELTMIILRLQIDRIKDKLADIMPNAARRFADINLSPDNLIRVRFNTMAAHKRPTSTQQSVPSWIIFGMFFVVIPMSTIFINERQQNTLTRLRTMNISIPALFAGKIAPYILINQLQVWLMIGVGIFIVPLFGGAALTLGTSISGLFMVSIGVSIAAIGTAVLIAVIAGTVEQATTIGGIINILMAAMGGVMVPRFIMPPVMREIAAFSPMSWGLDGFLDIFLRGLGAKAVLPDSLALAGFGLCLLIIAGMIFKAERKIL
ncbi:ABC transporter permease [Desulfobacterota bacterium M19]